MMAVAHKAIQSGRGSARRVCQDLDLSRSSYGRWRARRAAPDKDAVERKALLKIATQRPSCGVRTLRAHLGRAGLPIGRKRLRRLMREEGLVVKPRRRYVKTTDSNHTLAVYPNLTRELVLTDINQLWVADLTYVRLAAHFIYVAVILDAFSRRVIGWAISRNLRADFTVDALRMALRRRGAPAGLIHHSDRGSQYASNDYTGLLKDRGVAISMSAKGNPYDNAKAESFMKTFKYEEVYMMEYADEADARRRIGSFLDRIYNKERLHSALGYLPPAEFEQTLATRTDSRKEDLDPDGLDPRALIVRKQPSTGETEARSAGMQHARDIRPGPRRKTLGATPRGGPKP